MKLKLYKSTGGLYLTKISKIFILLLLILYIFSFTSDVAQSNNNSDITDSLEWQSCKNIYFAFTVWNNPNFLSGFYNVCGKLMYISK